MPASRALPTVGVGAVNALVLLVLLSALPSKANAYADPGTGAYLYQAIYAAVLGGAFYFRRLVTRLWRKRDK